jgi:glycolate oxidase iron-sulfur subunit
MATLPKNQAQPAPPELNRAAARQGAVREVVDYELLFDCVHCGLCLESCPTYVITRAEMDSPRGRIYLMKALAEGRLELDRDAVRHLDLCLECRGCETACPSGVRYGRLIEHARGYIERNWRRGIIECCRNRIIGAIFPYPARLRRVLAPLRLAERIGLRRLLRTLAPAPARDWLDLLPLLNQEQAPLFPADRDTRSRLFRDAASSEARSVMVHQGCVAQVLTQSANLNSERALAAAGYRVVPLARTVCCGALDIHHGNLARAREFARLNVAALVASGADSIISAASGCSAVIAQYGELLKDDSNFAAPAREIAERVTDLSSLLLDRLKPAALRTTRSAFRATVTYHDSCHLAHGLGVREQPRELLRSLPGVRLIELAESDLCCGSAGSYNLTERAMAHELARRKTDNIIATAAEYVVLSNPGCEFQIAAELIRRGSAIRVMHIADFLALAAGANFNR